MFRKILLYIGLRHRGMRKILFTEGCERYYLQRVAKDTIYRGYRRGEGSVVLLIVIISQRLCSSLYRRGGGVYDFIDQKIPRLQGAMSKIVVRSVAISSSLRGG